MKNVDSLTMHMSCVDKMEKKQTTAVTISWEADFLFDFMEIRQQSEGDGRGTKITKEHKFSELPKSNSPL